MAKEEPVNWQPISQMPLIASMITTSLAETREHLGTLTQAENRPQILDDATIDRVEQVHTEQIELVGIYGKQISRWRAEKLSRRGSAGWIAWTLRTSSYGKSPRPCSTWPASSVRARSTGFWA